MSKKKVTDAKNASIFLKNIKSRSLVVEVPKDDEAFIRNPISRSMHRCMEKYPCWKMGNTMPCESILERQVYTLFDVAYMIDKFFVQPAKIKYRIDGVWYVHYPDAFYVSKKKKKFIEIKYSKYARDPEVEKRTAFLSKELPQFGIDYEVLTEESIEQEPRLGNARYIHRNGWVRVSKAERDIFLHKYAKQGYILWGDVKSNKVPPLNHSKVCNLILEGYLKIPMREVWDDSTRLTFVEKKKEGV